MDSVFNRWIAVMRRVPNMTRKKYWELYARLCRSPRDMLDWWQDRHQYMDEHDSDDTQPGPDRSY